MPDARNTDESRIRPFWSGTIAFGLVSLPVSLFSANKGSKVSLRMVDDDGTPLQRQYFCPAEDMPLESDEIVRGYEIEKNEFVIVTDDELDALKPEKSQEIDLSRFVERSEIDPAVFERAYFLAPDRGATKAYRLLVRVMEETGRVGIATFVMRGKEYLVAIIAEEGLLRAETLRFADELRTPETIGLPALDEPDEERVAEIERDMQQLTSDELDRDHLTDPGTERLLNLVDAKLSSGEGVVEMPEEVAAEVERDEPVDIMKVLKASLEEAGQEIGQPGERVQSAQSGSLMDQSKEELYKTAKAMDISGRSGMSKQELADAVRRSR